LYVRKSQYEYKEYYYIRSSCSSNGNPVLALSVQFFFDSKRPFTSANMSTKFNNVLFLGVARLPGQAIILASYSYNAETDLGVVRQVLEQPNTRLQPGNHYAFTVEQLAWHLISGTADIVAAWCTSTHGFDGVILDDSGFIYIMIVAASYPQRCAHMGLEELQRTVRSIESFLLLSAVV
jgi:hypothetical protein